MVKKLGDQALYINCIIGPIPQSCVQTAGLVKPCQVQIEALDNDCCGVWQVWKSTPEPCKLIVRSI